MKNKALIHTLIEYQNNRLSPPEVREVQQWIQQHPQGNTLMKGLDTLLQQENRNESRCLSFLQQRKRDLGLKLFRDGNFG